MIQVSTNITFTIDTVFHKKPEVHIIEIPEYNYHWKCELTPIGPHLHIRVLNNFDAKYISFMDRTVPIQTVRVLSIDGKQLYEKLVAARSLSDPQIAAMQVVHSALEVRGRLNFRIVFSADMNPDLAPTKAGSTGPVLSTTKTAAENPTESTGEAMAKKPTTAQDKIELDVLGNHRVTANLMKDIKTMDMALTFGICGGSRNIALWAHRAALDRQPGLAKLISKLRDVEGSSADSATVCGVQSHHVTGYSLEAYCCLIRFIYTTKIELQVDLGDFAIGYPPNKPFSNACKERPTLDGLFPPNPVADTNAISEGEKPVTFLLVRVTTFGELFQLADCYQVEDLRAYCRASIIKSMNVSSALDILFGFAYRFEDLKDLVLKYVAENLDTIFAGDDEDPFEKYKDHPERHTLLAKALKLKFKAAS
ncbi:hypothetical protein BGZ93_010109 [Podila epicladia]|nr:hypothetical protein BGZ92_002963 [Podila epicladia]KAG0098854.1 hypothetical protein BGZ93_010109 [Podila epicladia]